MAENEFVVQGSRELRILIFLVFREAPETNLVMCRSVFWQLYV